MATAPLAVITESSGWDFDYYKRAYGTLILAERAGACANLYLRLVVLSQLEVEDLVRGLSV